MNMVGRIAAVSVASVFFVAGCGPRSVDRAKTESDKTVSAKSLTASSPADRKTNEVQKRKKPEPTASETPAALTLARTRFYRLDVAGIDEEIDVEMARQWTFRDKLPAELLSQIKAHPRHKLADNRVSVGPEIDDEHQSGYLRWPAEDKSDSDAGALLWYVDGPRRRELVVSLHMTVDHTMGLDKPKRSLAFGPLKVAVDLDGGSIGKVTWEQQALPQMGDAGDGVQVESTLQVFVLGHLSKLSSEAVFAADRVLSDELMRTVGGLGARNFDNASHHGITLGWLGHDTIRHGLLFVTGGAGEPIQFRYTAGGEPFPLAVVRNQLADDGWPLVLRGHEFVDSTTEGTHVFRPVEYVLSKAPAEKPKK
jgi:hypothetical protein